MKIHFNRYIPGHFNNLLGLMLFFCSFHHSFAQETRKIDVTANKLYVIEQLGPDVQIVIGSVEFKHLKTQMFCDSAYFNRKENFFRAYGFVHILNPTDDGDTVHVFGDSLDYDGRSRLAKIRGKVKMIKDSITLRTLFLDYDLKKDCGYYFDNGVTESGKDTLKSVYGYYYTKKDELHYKKNVVILNPKYKVFTDTMKYHTIKKTSYFYGPTQIISDSNFIYCENGWYNHNNDIAQFKKNSYILSKQHRLKGDSLYYDRKKGFGKAFKNVEIRDTVQHLLLWGNYGEYKEKTERSLLTDRAVFVQIGDKKDSMFLHADTIRSQIDTLKQQKDTLKYRIVKAYHKVKIFKKDMQSKCDSLVYNFKDSVIEMHKDPVIWSEENQLTANFIKLTVVNNAVERVDMNGLAFIVSKNDSVRFDQVKGKSMVGFLKNNKIDSVQVLENAESIYFMRDDDVLVGVNKISSKSMLIILENNKPADIRCYGQSTGTMNPPFALDMKELKLKDFVWLNDFTPKTKEDIFIWKNPTSKNTENKKNQTKNAKRNN